MNVDKTLKSFKLIESEKSSEPHAVLLYQLPAALYVVAEINKSARLSDNDTLRPGELLRPLLVAPSAEDQSLRVRVRGKFPRVVKFQDADGAAMLLGQIVCSKSCHRHCSHTRVPKSKMGKVEASEFPEASSEMPVITKVLVPVARLHHCASWHSFAACFCSIPKFLRSQGGGVVRKKAPRRSTLTRGS